MGELIRGFAFPFRFDPASGRVATASGDDKIRQNIIHVVLTSVGERPMRRAFGGGARRLLHEPIDDALLAITRREIGRAVEEHEPRVEIRGVDVSQEGATLFVTIHYVVLRTRAPGEATVAIGAR